MPARGGESPRGTPPWLALVLAAILLQGALHVFTGCVLFLLLFAAFNASRARAVLVTLLWTAAAGCVRLLPAVFVARRREQAFLTGFPSLLDLARGLLTILPPDAGQHGGVFGRVDPWEYDVYVGPAGLAFLLLGGVWLAFKGIEALPGAAERRLYGPMAVMAILSYGDAGVLLDLSRIPLLSAERVTTRLIALPILFLALLAAIRVERALRSAACYGSRVRRGRARGPGGRVGRPHLVVARRGAGGAASPAARASSTCASPSLHPLRPRPIARTCCSCTRARPSRSRRASRWRCACAAAQRERTADAAIPS